MSEKLKIGVLGCANIADRMVIPAIKESSKFDLVAIASRSIEKAREYAHRFDCEPIEGYNVLLQRNDIDVIYMPLPTGLHAEWGIKALENGKHVLIEKSLAINNAEAKRIIDNAKEKKLLVRENFMFQYHRQFKVIQDILSQKKLGEVRCIRSSFGFPPFPEPDNIRYKKELGGGALLDAGAYTIKIAQLLLGDGLQVSAASLNIDPTKEVDISGGIFMFDTNGVIVETAFGFDHFYQCNLEIWGSKGKLTASRIFTAGPGIKPEIKLEFQGNEETILIDPDNHFLNLLEDFRETIRSGDFEKDYQRLAKQAQLLQKVSDIAHFHNITN